MGHFCIRLANHKKTHSSELYNKWHHRHQTEKFWKVVKSWCFWGFKESLWNLRHGRLWKIIMCHFYKIWVCRSCRDLWRFVLCFTIKIRILFFRPLKNIFKHVDINVWQFRAYFTWNELTAEVIYRDLNPRNRKCEDANYCNVYNMSFA